MIPAALEDLQAGKSLSFGDLGATLEGLTCPGNPLLGWDLVSEAKIEKGKVQHQGQEDQSALV